MHVYMNVCMSFVAREGKHLFGRCGWSSHGCRWSVWYGWIFPTSIKVLSLYQIMYIQCFKTLLTYTLNAVRVLPDVGKKIIKIYSRRKEKRQKQCKKGKIIGYGRIQKLIHKETIHGKYILSFSFVLVVSTSLIWSVVLVSSDTLSAVTGT